MTRWPLAECPRSSSPRNMLNRLFSRNMVTPRMTGPMTRLVRKALATEVSVIETVTSQVSRFIILLSVIIRSRALIKLFPVRARWTATMAEVGVAVDVSVVSMTEKPSLRFRTKQIMTNIRTEVR